MNDHGLADTSIDLIKGVFITIGMVTLAMILYQLFFGKQNSALYVACYNVEKAVSNYYYAYCFYPSAHMIEGVSNSLGVTVNSDTNLQHADTDSNGSGYTHYTVTVGNW